MIATILLVIRLSLSIVLYIFIGWAFYMLLQDLRNQARRVSILQTPPLILVVKRPQGEEMRQFVHSPITIGRDQTCDCALEESTVSTRHAILTFHHNQWWLEDLDSTNGTLLNGQPVTEAVVLTTNDQVRCGQVDLQVMIALEETRTQPIASRIDLPSK
jgi:pSer/pThr/pTyr-binding forkhead associated (FHA) protein